MQSNTRILTLLLDDTGLPASMGTRIEDLVQRNRKDSLTKVLEEVTEDRVAESLFDTFKSYFEFR